MRRVPIVHFPKPGGSAEAASSLEAAVLAVIDGIGGGLRQAVDAAIAGGSASVDVVVNPENFPERVGRDAVGASPETLLASALEETRRRLAGRGLELDVREKRVSNRTRSAKLKLDVRKRLR